MNATQALGYIQDSFHKGRYFLDPHAKKRMKRRNVSIQDIRSVVMKATPADCVGYIDPARPAAPGATCWRVTGQDLDGVALSVGVDLTVDHIGGFTVVVTVI